MEVVAKNFGLMTLIMMGIISFYVRNQGIFGIALAKTAILYTIEAVVLSLIIIMGFTWLWNRAVAVEEAE